MEKPQEEQMEERKPSSWVTTEPSSTQSSRRKSIGKNVAITGAAVVSAPLLLPPFLILSAVGFALAFPFGVYLAGLALTHKFMSSLFARREKEEKAVHDVDDHDDDDEGGGESLARETEREEVREVGEGKVGKLLTTFERKLAEKEKKVPVEEPKKGEVEVSVEEPKKGAVEVPVEDAKVDKKGKAKKKGK